MYKLFANERLTTDEPFTERTIPEHPKWFKQPAPDYDKNWWLYRSAGPMTSAFRWTMFALLALAFIGMALWGTP